MQSSRGGGGLQRLWENTQFGRALRRRVSASSTSRRALLSSLAAQTEGSSSATRETSSVPSGGVHTPTQHAGASPRGAEAAFSSEVASFFFSKVKWTTDAPRASVGAALRGLRAKQHEFLRRCQKEAAAKISSANALEAAAASSELRRCLDLVSTVLEEQDDAAESLQSLSLKESHELTAMLLRQTAKVEELLALLDETLKAEGSSGVCEDKRQKAELEKQELETKRLLGRQWNVWLAIARPLLALEFTDEEAFLLLSSLGAVRALRSPNAVVSQLLLRVADRLEKASCSPEAATRPLCHPVACFWSPPSESLLALLQGAPLEAKVALVARGTQSPGAESNGFLPPKKKTPPVRVWRNLEPVDAEAEEAAQRRVGRTRFVEAPRECFWGGRKLKAALAFHIRLALPAASLASLAHCAVAFKGDDRVLRGDFQEETLEVFAEQLDGFSAEQLIPFLPEFVLLLRNAFPSQRRVAAKLTESALLLTAKDGSASAKRRKTQTLRRLREEADPQTRSEVSDSLLLLRSLLSVAAHLLGASAFEVPLAVYRQLTAALEEAMREAEADFSDELNQEGCEARRRSALSIGEVSFFCVSLHRSGIRDAAFVRRVLDFAFGGGLPPALEEVDVSSDAPSFEEENLFSRLIAADASPRALSEVLHAAVASEWPLRESLLRAVWKLFAALDRRLDAAVKLSLFNAAALVGALEQDADFGKAKTAFLNRHGDIEGSSLGITFE